MAEQPFDQDAARKKAVAVKKEQDQDLPRITASGRGVVAERILDIAFEEGVKVRQDRELTEILDAYEVDSPIPLEALGAVSEILSHVYAENARAEKTQTGDQEPDPEPNQDDSDNPGADI